MTTRCGFIASFSEDGLGATVKFADGEQIEASAALIHRFGLGVGDRVSVSEQDGHFGIEPLRRRALDPAQRAELKSNGGCEICGETRHYSSERRELYPDEALDHEGRVLRAGDRVELLWSGEQAYLEQVGVTLCRAGSQDAFPCELRRLARAADRPGPASALLYGPRQRPSKDEPGETS